MLHSKFDKLQRELGADVKDLDYSRADLVSRLRMVSKRLGVPAAIPSADSARPIVHITIPNAVGKSRPLPENDEDEEQVVPTQEETSTAAAASIVANVNSYFFS